MNITISEKLTRDNYLLWQTQVLPEIYGAQLFGYLDGSIEATEKETTVKDNDGVETTITKSRLCEMGGTRSICPRVSSSEHGQGGCHTDGGTPHFCSYIEGCNRDVCFTISGTGGANPH
jgi:hypothetical protein